MPWRNLAANRSRWACGKVSPRPFPRPCACWPTIGPIAAGSSSSFRFWAKCAGLRASRSCSGSPATRPTTRCERRRSARWPNYDDPAIPVEVIKAYANMSDDVRAAAQSLLVTRRAWATRFLEAIEAHTIDPHTLPREVVEKLLLLGDSRIDALTSRLFGAIKPSTVGRVCTRRSTGWPP